MTEKRDFSGTPISQSHTLPRRQPKPAKLDHNTPATAEEFDREGMGIAAKE